MEAPSLDFPFPTYHDFLQAHKTGKVRIWVRAGFRAGWRLGGFEDRLFYLVLFGAPWLFAAAFAALAIGRHSPWLLLGSLASLIGFWCASPSPGLISGGGCVVNSLFVASLIAAPFSGFSSVL